MDGYLLDNNILQFWYNSNLPEHLAVSARIASLEDGTPLTTSVVAFGEVEDGMRRVVAPDANQSARQAALRAWLANHFPYPLAVDQNTVSHYGEIRARIFRHCYPSGKGPNRPCGWGHPTATATQLGIEENDLWITSQAVQHKLILVTHDRMYNIRSVVADLVVIEDWAAPEVH